MARPDHWLAPLLVPRSIALVGASRRPGTVGFHMVETLAGAGFPGGVACINPRYDQIVGYPCLPSLAALPEAPDVAVLSVAAHRMKEVFGEALRAGARSLVVFDACFLEDDRDPPLLEWLKSAARDAGVPVCGGNGMGFINMDSRTWLSFQTPLHPLEGGIAVICHSGSVFSLLLESTARYRFNMVISPGQEISATVADYIDYALDVETTRVITLFIEAVRDPAAFVKALSKARAKRVPVVVVKVGRTEAAAALAATHSGAMAGNDSAFEALCDSWGVIRCRDLDEMMATAQVLAHDRQPGPGGLGVVTDSGGLREQLIDLADTIGMPFAVLDDSTRKALREHLAHGLEPVNPLDAAGPLGSDFTERFNRSALALARDPGVAIVAHELFVDDHFNFYPEVTEGLERLPAKTGKPHVLYCSLGACENADVALHFGNHGIPVINGARPMLVAMKHALAWRDCIDRRDGDPPPGVGTDTVARARAMLEGGVSGEAELLGLVSMFGIGTVPSQPCGDRHSALEAGRETGFPVALKTAMPGINHKSDRNGVMLNLADTKELDAAYTGMAGRLGPCVTVAAMAPQGVEMAFGAFRDAQFGPVVMVSAGGVMLEWMDDKAFAMPPFGPARAPADRTIEDCTPSRGKKGRAAGRHRRSGFGILPVLGDDRQP